MAWIKPATSLDLNELDVLLKCKMHAYLSVGTDTMPADIEAMEALYSGATPPFLPLGDLHKDPIKFGWERTTQEMHAGTIRSGLKITGEIQSAALSKDAIDLLDDEDLDGDCSILLVPFNVPAAADVSETNPAKYIILNGVKIVDNGEGNGNNAYGKLTLTLSAEPNEIDDVINILTFDEAPV